MTPALPPRITIQNVHPELDAGRHPVKREVGDFLDVWAEIYKDGHDKIAAALRIRPRDTEIWDEVPMRLGDPGLDRWSALYPLERNTRYRYTLVAWSDAYGTWCDEIGKKRGADQNVDLELIEGRGWVEAAQAGAQGADSACLQTALARFDKAESAEARAQSLLGSDVAQAMQRAQPRADEVVYAPELEVIVDRVRARFAAWYEMFPRSQGRTPGRSATFAECAERLPEIRDMGFDVVYLVPIHPIGTTHRKGPNNSTVAAPGDPGSPYAIGSPEGGHMAVHPELGTLGDFRAFVKACHGHGMEVALDFAIQCSPDHPWITEHPDWFRFRPDGTIKYAENPPKKYQDIVNIEFYGPHREALWQALRQVVLFWVEQGVKIFRVDNPHTKPVPFWAWLIETVQTDHPDVLFLAEAFTRPPMLHKLAKVGFSQSYSYFTWRNFKDELTDYLTELVGSEIREFLRPNFFTCTPDILPEYLQRGGRPAFVIRQVLAATLSSVYGIYNGFELCEGRAVPGKEEYLSSEKYDYKVWDWDRVGHIKDCITTVNEIRRDNEALHELENLRFYPASDDDVLFYGKMTLARDNMIFVAVNLDPFEAHESTVTFPLAEMGLSETDAFGVEELLSGARHLWRGAAHHVSLHPEINPAAIYRITRWTRIDYRSPSY